MKERYDSTDKNNWIFGAVVAAVLAVFISLLAWFFAYRADVVILEPITGYPQFDVYRAQVEELQRANDRILNTAWAVMGIVVALASILVTFNFVRSERVIGRERTLIEERFEAQVKGQYQELEERLNRQSRSFLAFQSSTGEELSRLSANTEAIRDELRSERQGRAELEFRLVQFQQDMMRMAHDITASGPILPFYYTRVYGPLPAAVNMLSAAIESNRTSLINEALRRLGNAASGPIPGTDLALLDDIIGDVEALSDTYDPLREETLRTIRQRLQSQLNTDQGPDEGS